MERRMLLQDVRESWLEEKGVIRVKLKCISVLQKNTSAGVKE